MKKLLKLLFICSFTIYAFNSLASPVNVNTADAKTLSEALNGIGQKKAEAIVKYRDEKGLFKSVEDLANVPGIGEKIVEKNKGDILISGASVEANKDKK